MNFILKRETAIPRIGNVKHFIHKTGLEWIHVHQPIKNNVFNVAFKTDLHSSTGIAHILEHTTLCGSQKFPTRDPFFKMLNRSYSNFMNALTGDDLTMYPFSTVSNKDYFNLMDVYLDACFNPLLNLLDFKQESWRLEKKGSEYEFKGVVYNEMKGALGDPSSWFYQRNQIRLFKDSVYGYCSGGDPTEITNLTHEQLVTFHKERYHPSNAFIYTFGDIPVEEQMERVEKVLEPFKRLERKGDLTVNRWQSPKFVEEYGPLDSMIDAKKQNRVSVSFLTTESTNFNESLNLRILTDLLTDGAASPMYKALIDSNLGTDYSPNTGFSPYTYQTSVGFGLQGVADEHVQSVTNVIMDCLADTSKTGFPKQRIESVFHQLELALKHRTAKFGMNLGWNVLRTMVHGGDPFETLNYESNIENLKSNVFEPQFLESKITSNFLENPHRLDYVMKPSESFGEKLVEEEQKRLKLKVASLTEADKEEVNQQALDLAKQQLQKQDVSCLPNLSLDEVPKEPITFPTTQEILEFNGGKLEALWRNTLTNGISYVRLKFNIDSLPQEYALYMPLFCRALTSLGTNTLSLAEFDEKIRNATGGVSAYCYSQASHSNHLQNERYIEFSGNAINSNLAKLYDLLHQTMFETNWNAKDELLTCLQTMLAEYTNSVVGNGHVYAMRSAGSTLTPSMKQAEDWSGISQITFLEQLVNKGDMEELSKVLANIAKLVFNDSPSSLVISEMDQEDHKQHLAKILNAVEQPKTIAKTEEVFTPTFESKNKVMDVGINFTSRALLGVPYTHPDSAPLKILSSLLSSQFLHRELREKGGAYGGGAKYSALDGVFYFMTYRDPIGYQRTFSTYDQSVEWSVNISQHVSNEDLGNAKLEVLKNSDLPVDASQEGVGYFHCRIDESEVKEYRDRILRVSIEDVEKVARLYLKKETSDCVIGEKLEQ